MTPIGGGADGVSFDGTHPAGNKNNTGYLQGNPGTAVAAFRLFAVFAHFTFTRAQKISGGIRGGRNDHQEHRQIF
ncbi:hypothetical protein [Gimesia algae]|uniref:hypothetical protein n=1 Tax=Gimesia algae TaxID=2527971 RepID=UPI0018D897DD|nr:hypothetical protein [Gimesia algae]